MIGNKCQILTVSRALKTTLLLFAFLPLPVWSQEPTSEDVPSAEAVQSVEESVEEEIAAVEETVEPEQEEVISAEEDEKTGSSLSADVEDLKKSAMELNRDLLILEEELLFPASTQVVIFLSMDVGEYFKLDSVKISIDEKVVASHLYTNRQNHALEKGGIQRLYMGNLKNGVHEVTAIFTGLGPDNREYKRGATTIVDKDDDLKMIELMIRDSSKNMQPEFEFKEWEL